jgi:hypothetical protein
MASATLQQAPEAPEKTNPFARIVGVIFSPKATFTSIGRQPTWLAPVILTTLISLAMNIVLAQRVDWRTYLQVQLEKTGRSGQITNEQQMNLAVKIQKIIRYVRGVIGDVSVVLLGSAIYLGIFNLIVGANVKFKSVLAVTAFVTIPTAIKELIGIAVLLLKDPSTINPDNFVMSGLNAFIGSNPPNWLLALGLTVDIFIFWGMYLAVVGFSSMGNKKIKRGTAFGAVFGIYLFFMLLAVGASAAFS